MPWENTSRCLKETYTDAENVIKKKNNNTKKQGRGKKTNRKEMLLKWCPAKHSASNASVCKQLPREKAL